MSQVVRSGRAGSSSSCVLGAGAVTADSVDADMGRECRFDHLYPGYMRYQQLSCQFIILGVPE